MEITWDVHGHTMWDAWKGRRSFDVVERDDGFIDSIDGSSYLAGFDEWPEIERKAMGPVKGPWSTWAAPQEGSHSTSSGKGSMWSGWTSRHWH